MSRGTHEGDAAVVRLGELGLTVEDIHAALSAGQGEARSWSEAAPRVMPGMARWGRINEHFRIRKGREGWRFENPSGLPLTINPSDEFAIVATTGDAQTGRSASPAPTTKYAKGVTYQKVVEDNVQLPLFVDAAIGPKLHDVIEARRATWILLYHVTVRGIAAELSLPGSMTEQGYVDRWTERILIPFHPFEDVQLDRDQHGEDGEGFDVAVERR